MEWNATGLLSTYEYGVLQKNDRKEGMEELSMSVSESGHWEIHAFIDSLKVLKHSRSFHTNDQCLQR